MHVRVKLKKLDTSTLTKTSTKQLPCKKISCTFCSFSQHFTSSWSWWLSLNTGFWLSNSSWKGNQQSVHENIESWIFHILNKNKLTMPLIKIKWLPLFSLLFLSHVVDILYRECEDRLLENNLQNYLTKGQQHVPYKIKHPAVPVHQKLRQKKRFKIDVRKNFFCRQTIHLQ